MDHISKRQATVMVSLSRAINIILGLVVFGMAIYWSTGYWNKEYDIPIKYLSIAVLTRDVAPGDTIAVRVTSDRRRPCAGTTDRFIIKMSDGPTEEIAYSDSVRTLPDIGESINVIGHLKLPDDIKPGTYIYRAFTHLDCDGKKWRIPVPEASFRVVGVDLPPVPR